MFGGLASSKNASSGMGFGFGSNNNANTNTNTNSGQTGFGLNNNINNNNNSNNNGGLGVSGQGFGAKASNPFSSQSGQNAFGSTGGFGGFGGGSASGGSGGNTNSGSMFGGSNAPGGFSLKTGNNPSTNTMAGTSGLGAAGGSGGLGGLGSGFGSGFGFGMSKPAAAGTGAGTGTGTGGQTQTQTGGGLFGNSTSGGAFNLGNTSNSNNNSNNTQQNPFQGFGLGNNNNNNINTNNSASGTNFGSTGGGLFGNVNQQQQQQQQQQQLQQQIPQLTSLTRVSDLPEAYQKEIEELDKYIKLQLQIAEGLKNEEANHKELIDSIPRDIKYLENKYYSVNQALSSDLKFIDSFKSKNLETFNDWVERLLKLYLQLTNQDLLKGNNGLGSGNGASPVGNQQQGRYNSSVSANATNILNQYYILKIEDFVNNIEKYKSILQEIENTVNNMDKISINGLVDLNNVGGLDLIVRTLKEEFHLFMELSNNLAELHHEVKKMGGAEDKF